MDGDDEGKAEHLIGDIMSTRKYKPVRFDGVMVLFTKTSTVYKDDCAGIMRLISSGNDGPSEGNSNRTPSTETKATTELAAILTVNIRPHWP